LGCLQNYGFFALVAWVQGHNFGAPPKRYSWLHDREVLAGCTLRTCLNLFLLAKNWFFLIDTSAIFWQIALLFTAKTLSSHSKITASQRIVAPPYNKKFKQVLRIKFKLNYELVWHFVLEQGAGIV
jgi:hypothetical protein